MSEARRKSILESAARDRELVGQVPAVVAAGFGILALRRLGDVLTVACLPRANRDALRLLREVLQVEIVATPFEERLLHRAIQRAYFEDEEGAVNFPTFLEPDFLERAESAAVLREEKREEVGTIRAELEADQVALAALTYRAALENLDAETTGPALPDPRRTRLDLGDLDLGWRREGDRYQVFEATPAQLDAAQLVATQFRLSEYRHMHGGGRVSEHHVRRDLVPSLPLVIHPTEVQVVGLDAQGIELHVYHHRERFAPGGSGRVELSYYFLSSGNRMRRRIALELHELAIAGREAVEARPGPARWTGTELGRWFGLPAAPPLARSRP